ncbi:MAG: 30S ribosomal protein S2 [Rickettsiales bacterium]|nr:30S ribosomal protein S2 [Rickettsiales bacterium]
MSTNIPKFTIKQLLEAGVHFGHKSMRRNPKMQKYIYTTSNGVSIINLNKTAPLLHNSLKVVKDITKNNGKILFVATKKQAADQIAEAAKRCGQYYVNFRWLGGMLTNWKTVSRSIKTLRKIEEQLSNDDIGLNKKEKLVLERKRLKLEQALGGIKDMGGYPDLIFIIDTFKESLAIAEAKTLKIPIMSIVDSNCNPDGITFPIPGNDDSTKSISLYCDLISEAAIAGVKENMANSGIDVSKITGETIANFRKPSQPKESAAKKITKKVVEVKSEVTKPFKKKEIIKKTDAQKAEEQKEEKSRAKKPTAKKSVGKKTDK